MRRLLITGGNRIYPYRQTRYSEPRLAEVLCDREVVGSVRERGSATLSLSEGAHIVQCVQPTALGQVVSDVVNIPAGQEDVSLRLEWGEQSLFLSLVR